MLSSASALSHQASLIELGVDSLTGSELRNAIERSMGVSVSISNLIDGSSLDAVIETVAAQIERRLVTEHSSTTGAETEEITL
ncbi:acyl carrier protein [Burkholderia thailandensis]|uniref:acyl carrier protein n=1 Tax=Burkholderia thailandensis TaxID=57975 RepID=UPI001D020A68|nr:acyl carrier protein [Burkholderia thailandensis]